MSYRDTINNFHTFLLSIDREITCIKVTEERWSLTEIVGHLIDSAANNQFPFGKSYTNTTGILNCTWSTSTKGWENY